MKSKKKIFVLVISGCFLVFLAFFCQSYWQNIFYRFYAPGHSFFDKIIFKNNCYCSQGQDLAQENALLIQQIEGLESQLQENARLEKLSNVSFFSKEEFKKTEIVWRDFQENLFLLRGGEDFAFAQGMPIVTLEGILIGRIEKVFKDFSLASFLNSSGNAFDVKIKTNQGDILALAQGGGDKGLEIKYIPKEKEIPLASSVFTVSLGGNFPDGLMVGKIYRLNKNEAEPFQEAIASPSFLNFQISTLLVMTSFRIPLDIETTKEKDE